MKAVIFAFVPVLLVLALVLPAVRLAHRPLEPWTRGLAAILGLLAAVLVVFLVSEDDYAPGRSNWSAYHVEYAAVPTVVGALGAALWLRRKEGSDVIAFASPLIALCFSAAAYVCLVLTVN